MSFLRPEMLWLLLLLLVPLVLYLLPLPRQRVTSIALFLWERFLQSERLGRTSERFRRALGFAFMAVIIAALAAAAAELSLGRPAVDARRLVVLLDVSASMNGVTEGRSNLDRAKAAAQELIASLRSDTEVAVAEAAWRLRLLAPFAPVGQDTARHVAVIERFEGPGELSRALEEACDLWGDHADCEIYVFTDGPLPPSRWGRRAHAWIAPPAGNNAAIVALSARRGQRKIQLDFTLANYGRSPREMSGTIFANGIERSTFSAAALGPGQTARRQAAIEEPASAAVEIRLDGGPDALAIDDHAYITVPGLDDLGVRTVWPAGGKHNAYVAAVLASLAEEGTIGRVVDESGSAPLAVFVNQSPNSWPEGGVIVLHPLRPGVIGLAGLHAEPVTVTRQAAHLLLNQVDLRGQIVKDAVQAEVPPWAEPIVWAGDLPLVWAGENGRTKALIVALPLSTDDSRLPLSAAFPLLMRNACRWMLPQPGVLRPGEPVAGWTSRRVGLIKRPGRDRPSAFSLLSPAESDLRREGVAAGAAITQHRSLTFALVMLAVLLLPIEWGLFHRRLTE
jgi:hypothetical protein